MMAQSHRPNRATSADAAAPARGPRADRFTGPLTADQRARIARAFDAIVSASSARFAVPRSCAGSAWQTIRPPWCEGMHPSDAAPADRHHCGHAEHVDASLMPAMQYDGRALAARVEAYVCQHDRDPAPHISLGMEIGRAEIKLSPREARQLAAVLVELADQAAAVEQPEVAGPCVWGSTWGCRSAHGPYDVCEGPESIVPDPQDGRLHLIGACIQDFGVDPKNATPTPDPQVTVWSEGIDLAVRDGDTARELADQFAAFAAQLRQMGQFLDEQGRACP